MQSTVAGDQGVQAVEKEGRQRGLVWVGEGRVSPPGARLVEAGEAERVEDGRRVPATYCRRSAVRNRLSDTQHPPILPRLPG